MKKVKLVQKLGDDDPNRKEFGFPMNGHYLNGVLNRYNYRYWDDNNASKPSKVYLNMFEGLKDTSVKEDNNVDWIRFQPERAHPHYVAGVILVTSS